MILKELLGGEGKFDSSHFYLKLLSWQCWEIAFFSTLFFLDLKFFFFFPQFISCSASSTFNTCLNIIFIHYFSSHLAFLSNYAPLKHLQPSKKKKSLSHFHISHGFLLILFLVLCFAFKKRFFSLLTLIC